MGDGDGDVELVRIVAPVARARRAYAEAVAVSLLKISPQVPSLRATSNEGEMEGVPLRESR